MTWRRPVSTIRSERSSCRALLTASRDAPVHAASSSWESGSSISIRPSARRPEALGQLDEAVRDAPDDVVGREVGLLRVGVAQAPRDHPQDHERHARTALEERREGRARDQQGLDRLERGHRGRARLAVDRRQLAEQVAGPADRDDHLAAGGAERRDLGAAAQQHDHRPRLVALVEERHVGAVGAPPADGPQVVGLGLRQRVEEGAGHVAEHRTRGLEHSARAVGGCGAGRGRMSSQRASGIATVMFTDVEASTDMTTRMGDDAAARLFGEHDRIVREQVAAHGGRTVRSTGDGFLVLFDSAREAVGVRAVDPDGSRGAGGRHPGADRPQRRRGASRATASCSARRSTSPRA